MKSLKIGSLKISLQEIELDFGLNISTFEITSNSGSAKLDPFHLQLSEPGKFNAKVTATAVQNLLAAKSPKNIQGFKVKIVEGQVLIDATANIIVSIPVKAVCTLEIVDKKQLFVRLQGVDMMGGKATNIIQSQIDKINPILDAKDLPLDVEITEVILENDLINLFGIVNSS